MKHFFRTLSLWFSVSALIACNGEQRSVPVKVTFTIEAPTGTTRVPMPDPADEQAALHWTLLLFRDGELADYGISASTGAITRELERGSYTAWAVVNCPEDAFRPESVRTLEELEETVLDLGDNRLPGLLMAGRESLRIPEDTDGGTRTIPVDRLVCKAGIRKITVRMEDHALSARPFVLKSVYLTNCPRKGLLGRDATISDLSAEEAWAHPMGYRSEPSVDALLADTGIDADIASGSSHTVPHLFYGCPNPVGSAGDSRSRTAWTPRCTRIVIEATVGGKTYYYPVTLPATARNKTYIAEEAIIRGLGSLDPEEDVPGALDVVFSTSTEEWSPVYRIDEQS